MDKILYYADTKDDLDSVAEMFGAFHDARFYDVHCVPSEDRLDVIIQYDDCETYVLLRFLGGAEFNYVARDHEADWFYGTKFHMIGEGTTSQRILWTDEDADYEKTGRKPTGMFWVEADKLQYALLNNNLCSVEIPKEWSHCVLHTFNYELFTTVPIRFDYDPKRV